MKKPKYALVAGHRTNSNQPEGEVGPMLSSWYSVRHMPAQGRHGIAGLIPHRTRGDDLFEWCHRMTLPVLAYHQCNDEISDSKSLDLATITSVLETRI